MSLIETTAEPRYQPGSRLPWTKERNELLTTLWMSGLSVRYCARQLEVSPGCISGKISRLGLPKRECDLNNRSKSASAREFRHKAAKPRAILPDSIAVTVPEPSAFERPATACALLELGDDQCHFPIGEPGAQDFIYCGGPATYRRYCECHARVAYTRRARQVG
jgi:GcrA cell cycle regulator